MEAEIAGTREASREATSVEIAVETAGRASESRSKAMSLARDAITFLEERLGDLAHERKQANSAWEVAEHNLRAEMQGHVAFLEQAEAPDREPKAGSVGVDIHGDARSIAAKLR